MADIPVNANDAVIVVIATSDGQTDFDFDFLAYRGDDLKARHVNAAGAEVNLVFPTNFTASNLGNPNGGSITWAASNVVAGERVVIYRDTVVERLTDFAQSGDYLADTVNREEDVQIMIMQEQRRDLDRTLRTEIGDTVLDPLPVPVDGLALVGNPTGTGFVNGPSTAQIEGAASAATRAEDAATRAEAAATNGGFVAGRTELLALDTSAISHATIEFGGFAGAWTWDASVAIATHQADPNSRQYIAPDAAANGAWVRLNVVAHVKGGTVGRDIGEVVGAFVNIEDFRDNANVPLAENSAQDAAVALERALAYVGGLPTGGTVWIPPGRFWFLTQCNVPKASNVAPIAVCGSVGSTLDGRNVPEEFMLQRKSVTEDGPSYVTFRDLFFRGDGSVKGAMDLHYMSGVCLERCTFEFFRKGVEFTESFSVRMVQCRFNNVTGDAIRINGRTKHLVLDRLWMNKCATVGGTAHINIAATDVANDQHHTISIERGDFEGGGTLLRTSGNGAVGIRWVGNYHENADQTNTLFEFLNNPIIDFVCDNNQFSRGAWDTDPATSAQPQTQVLNRIHGGSFKGNRIRDIEFEFGADAYGVDVANNRVLTSSGYLAKAPDPWTAITPDADWTLVPNGFTPLGVRMDRNGMVHLRGDIDKTINAPAANGDVMFQVPTWARADFNMYMATGGQTGPSGIQVSTNGLVVWKYGDGTHRVSLNGTSYWKDTTHIDP